MARRFGSAMMANDDSTSAYIPISSYDCQVILDRSEYRRKTSRISSAVTTHAASPTRKVQAGIRYLWALAKSHGKPADQAVYMPKRNTPVAACHAAALLHLAAAVQGTAQARYWGPNPGVRNKKRKVK